MHPGIRRKGVYDIQTLLGVVEVIAAGGGTPWHGKRIFQERSLETNCYSITS